MAFALEKDWAALVGTLALAAGCAYPETAPMAPGPLSPAAVTYAASKWPDATPASLESGRSTFLSHCNHCHGYPDVLQIKEERWPQILERMGAKAELTPAQIQEVLHFVVAERIDRSHDNSR